MSIRLESCFAVALYMPYCLDTVAKTHETTRRALVKVNIELEMTPEEFRQAMGLPDVQPFQEELMNKIKEQMEAGVEGYDALSLLKPFVSQGFDSVSSYQKMMMDLISSYGQSNS